jgi:IS4 transposase
VYWKAVTPRRTVGRLKGADLAGMGLAASVADLYRCRWQIEVFFKQIKQSLQLCDFLLNSGNAIRWQIWTALLLYVLTRFHALEKN